MIDAFICDARRTPIGRYGGSLSSIRPDDLAALTLRELMTRNPKADWAAVDDVILGCANQAGEDNRNVARMALLLAGLPETVPGSTVNRLCGSGMDAVAGAARLIKAGEADMVIAGGVESMSRAPYVIPKADSAFSRAGKMEDTTLGWRLVNTMMKKLYGVDSMPETAENVAAEYGVTRADQDAYAWRSQMRAKTAQETGVFANELMPVSIPQKRGEAKVIVEDEHPRGDTTLEGLAKLPTPFRDGGSVTAGNASGLNDGACALLIASERAIKTQGLTPLARIVAGAATGVAPRVMGIGPIPATRKLLQLSGLNLKSFDVIELNEAFAAQTLAVTRALGLPDDADWINPNGGAIALGHPLGMSGARLVATATYELHRRKASNALCAMCIGVGQGIALAIKRI